MMTSEQPDPPGTEQYEVSIIRPHEEEIQVIVSIRPGMAPTYWSEGEPNEARIVRTTARLTLEEEREAVRKALIRRHDLCAGYRAGRGGDIDDDIKPF